jgi:2-keto-4-pentenoate hydratase/2-oxohepta-3-ene-1,7-dioic acid hydratase in catechol pathway
MKIICIGRNYVEHAKELNNPVPDEPVFFMKPDSSLLINNKPFFLPDFSKEIHHEVEIVIKINRLGKNIQQKFASRYYNKVTVGIDFTARDLQHVCKEKGKPWEIAKGFDGSAVLGKFISLSELENQDEIAFNLEINGKPAQKGNTHDMLFSIDRIIEYISQFVTLKMGDIIYTGTPAGVGPVKVNDRLEAYIEDKKLLDFLVK